MENCRNHVDWGNAVQRIFFPQSTCRLRVFRTTGMTYTVQQVRTNIHTHDWTSLALHTYRFDIFKRSLKCCEYMMHNIDTLKNYMLVSCTSSLLSREHRGDISQRPHIKCTVSLYAVYMYGRREHARRLPRQLRLEKISPHYVTRRSHLCSIRHSCVYHNRSDSSYK